LGQKQKCVCIFASERAKIADVWVYSIQHNVIKVVGDLQQVGGFFRELRFPPPTTLIAMI
jgi:hypothetical protein